MKVICFDVDMTLYDHNSREIPASALEAVEILRKDHKIVLTTGRDLEDGYCTSILEQIKPDAMVHCNGARVEADGKVLLNKGFFRELTKPLFSYALDHGLTVGALYDEKAFCTNTELCFKPLKAFCDGVGLSVRDYKEIDREPVYELFYFGREPEARKLEQAFPMLRLPMYATGNASDIVYRGVSKATGLSYVLRHYGLGFQDVIAVGDSNNDLELIQEAGVGIAMGNGSASLKRAADYVTSSIDEDGIYKAFCHLGML